MRHDDLSDEELVDLILESLGEDDRVRTEFLKVECIHGKPVLAGRVGKDEELQAIEEILNDVLEIHDYENNVWVDDTLSFSAVTEEGAADLEEDSGLETDATFEPDDEEEEK